MQSIDNTYKFSLIKESWDDTKCVSVSQDSQDTFPKGYTVCGILGILYVESWGDTEYVRVSQDSQDTFPEGYTVCGILG